jgi:hypothetical protein
MEVRPVGGELFHADVMELLVASHRVADTQKHRQLFVNAKSRDQFEFTFVTLMNFVSFILD